MLKLFKFLLRLFPGLFAFYSGLMKFGGQFTATITKLEDVQIANSSEMVFAFYSNSGAYIYVIATTQILGGLLLIYKKTQLIGALICLTVFVNVMLINYSFHFSHALVLFMAVLNLSYLVTLLFEYKKLRNLLID